MLIHSVQKVSLPQPISIGFYINCFRDNAATWKCKPMKLIPLDRAKMSTSYLQSEFIRPAMERDPSDNVTKQDANNAPFSRNRETKFSVSQRNVIVHVTM